MAVVIRGVEVLAIPTGGEINLSSNGVALHRRKSVTLLGATIVDAHHADGFLGKVCVVLSTV